MKRRLETHYPVMHMMALYRSSFVHIIYVYMLHFALSEDIRIVTWTWTYKGNTNSIEQMVSFIEMASVTLNNINSLLFGEMVFIRFFHHINFYKSWIFFSFHCMGEQQCNKCAANQQFSAHSCASLSKYQRPGLPQEHAVVWGVLSSQIPLSTMSTPAIHGAISNEKTGLCK